MASDKILVHAFSGSPFAWRVLIALTEKDLPFEVDFVQRASGRHRTKEFLELNPRGKLPIMRMGDIVSYESVAFCHLLEYLHPERPLLPADPKTRALALMRIQETEYLYEPFEEAIRIGLFTPPAERNPDHARAVNARVIGEIAQWERYFSTADAYGRRAGPYLAGSDFSLADICLFPTIAFCVRCKLRLGDRFPNVAKWHAAIETRPSVQQTFPPHWRGTEGTDIGLNDV